ncbi:GATA zinc finger domain-containing protein 14-like isoform X2 [Trichogramma pretiosum]|uniref:GATA zinc finger domain-containing protein 14-like isoform X2 n=1 Tax=Trichogramma pretiosum TaxID=7493 RepID=UPI0006C9495B|nr:GATA zinc finger domain-containing protein 14-like isoform X2 [Trichogramma pretiosum]
MVNVESISSLISSGVDSAAQMSIGQAILKAIDKVLWTIEKSVQWSLPSTDVRMEVNGKPSSEVDFVRPLPWILFLPTLIFLRVVRISINLTASVLGYPKVEPIDMIQVLQKSRKRIQAIKSTGMKNMKLNKGSTTKKMLVTNTVKQSEINNEFAKPLGSMDIDEKNNQEFAESNNELISQKEINGSRNQKIPVKAINNSSTNSNSINSKKPESKNHFSSVENEFDYNNQRHEKFDQNNDKSVPEVGLSDKHVSDQKSSVPNATHNKQNNKNKIKYNRKKK